jgi:hypothetical protein
VEDERNAKIPSVVTSIFDEDCHFRSLDEMVWNAHY